MAKNTDAYDFEQLNETLISQLQNDSIFSNLSALTKGQTEEPDNFGVGDIHIVGNTSTPTQPVLKLQKNDTDFIEWPSASPWSGWSGDSTFTIEFYFNHSQTSQNIIFTNQDSDKIKGIRIGTLSDGRPYASIRDGSTNTNYVEGSSTLNDDTDYILSIRYDGNSNGLDTALDIFVDGVEEAYQNRTSETLFDIDNGNGFNIGLPSNHDQNKQYNGTIYELRIWSDVRSDSEIGDNVGKQLDGGENNLAGYWAIDEGSGDSITDDSSNSNTGTNQGAAWVTTENVLTGFLTNQDAFEGHSNEVAIYKPDGWSFFSPQPGLRAYVESTKTNWVYDLEDGWRSIRSATGGAGTSSSLTYIETDDEFNNLPNNPELGRKIIDARQTPIWDRVWNGTRWEPVGVGRNIIDEDKLTEDWNEGDVEPGLDTSSDTLELSN